MDPEARIRAAKLALRDQERRQRRVGNIAGNLEDGLGEDGDLLQGANPNRGPPDFQSTRVLKHKIRGDYEEFRKRADNRVKSEDQVLG